MAKATTRNAARAKKSKPTRQARPAKGKARPVRNGLFGAGSIVFEGESSTSTMRRSFTELVEWLLNYNPVPPGSILLTGTGLVPPDDFTLLPGHFVEIHVPQIGTLVNPVVRASELIQKEPES